MPQENNVKRLQKGTLHSNILLKCSKLLQLFRPKKFNIITSSAVNMNIRAVDTVLMPTFTSDERKVIQGHFDRK